MASEAPNDLLVGLLHEASELEHCLLDSYLYAACALKSHPEEFATLPDGRENRRRAIQFERTRAWKQSILHVAQEEMGHLHYVQCLIRALGEAPYFGLPQRDATTGAWLFGSWRARIGSHEPAQGTEVPVEPLTPAGVRRFVLYEATDALQDDDPFGPESMKLFESLHAFELDCLFESALFDVDDAAEREALKGQLVDLYTTLAPAEPAPQPKARLAAAAPPPISAESVQFQSIADLYNNAILPLYREAFDFGRVPYSNLDLNAELQDPNYAAEGFLPIGPVKRDKNFDARAAQNELDPLRHYKDVADVVAEIVEEGEGLQGFVRGAQALLAKVAELGGARAYLQAVQADQQPDSPSTPPWLAEAQRVRLSHLYQFAMTMVELDSERELASQAGVAFDPARTPLPAGADPTVDRLAAEAAEHFNVCYLALVAWLARLYEVTTWESDRRRRMGIEMLAAWPMMSIAIRPFLELLSFLPVDRALLFRTDDDAALPSTPVHARQLLRLYAAPDRSQEIHDRMDYYALRALSDVARWATEQREALAEADIDPLAKRMMRGRLDSLAGLDEFERQFPYREHGGYSDRSPDLQYQIQHPGGAKYEETPGALFEDSLVLRLRFAGRGLVQLATDPDPPTDEVGCTGTHMLHPADGERWFDRALIWQPTQAENVIVREPRERLPPLGVRAAEVALMVTDAGGATAGYVPLAVMQSAGAVQTTGVQQQAEIDGLNPIVALSPDAVLGAGAELRVDLLPRDGTMPYLNGYNHLVWQDGEPIDPFILSVTVAAADGETAGWLQREVFNDSRTLMQMDPLQRLQSSRGPCGFDFNLGDIPAWVMATLGEEERRLLADPGFPISYLAARAAVLREALTSSLHDGAGSQAAIDRVVSFMERMRLVAVPRSTTVGWLTVLLNYGHTVSGTLGAVGSDDVLRALGARIGARLSISTARRGEPNGRWMVKYAKGVMDTDALSDLVFGELYVPLTVQPSPGEPARFERAWRFAAGMEPLLASYACRFEAPFWGTFAVDADTRSTAVPGGGPTITGTLADQADAGYSYTATGLPGVTDYAGSFAVSSEAGAAVLTWSVSFVAATPASVVQTLTINAGAAEAMGAALAAHFAPVG